MTVLAISGGDIALIVLAAFWGLLVLFLCVVLLNTFRVLESTKMLIDGIREETVPLLGEVKTTVQGVNKELERVDGVMESAGRIVASIQRVTSLVEQAAATPLLKVIGMSAGVRRFAKRMGGDKSSASAGA
jgi:uncharacterized protein YoxC